MLSKMMELKSDLTNTELILAIVPALHLHYEVSENKHFKRKDIFNAVKNNPRYMLISRYNSLVKRGYIKCHNAQ